jgi:hypothetical protein
MSSIAVPEIPSDAREEHREPQPVGPLWMAAGIFLLFVTYTALGTIRHIIVADTGNSVPHVVTYLSQILGTWLLLAATIATVYHRRQFLRECLLDGARPWSTEIARGFTVFVIVLACAGIVGGLFYFASQRLWLFNSVSHLMESTNHRLSLKHGAELLGPASGVDLLFWALVSLSAGICEEIMFRGYLLRQCIAALRRLSLSQDASAAVAVVLTAAIFGAVHLYEGAGSVLTIGFLGACYAIAALRFGNLRAVIVAHSLQDLIAGIVAYVHHIPGIR